MVEIMKVDNYCQTEPATAEAVQQLDTLHTHITELLSMFLRYITKNINADPNYN